MLSIFRYFYVAMPDSFFIVKLFLYGCALKFVNKHNSIYLSKIFQSIEGFLSNTERQKKGKGKKIIIHTFCYKFTQAI